ncbi:MAG: nicotinate-nucleotide adenylyltransferase [Pseudomonadota bacterium]
MPHYPATKVPLPVTASGQSIGLFGGSFDPLHDGHLLVMKRAFVSLSLDWFWWLVTPGNPLKAHQPTQGLSGRVEAIDRAVHHPRSVTLAIEQELGVRYSSDTIAMLRTMRPDARFVWIMGADNLANFHRWHDWRGIADTIPIAIVDRPGANQSCLSSMFARTYHRSQIDPSDAAMLPSLQAPAWTFIRGPLSPLSSEAIRSRHKSRRYVPNEVS